MPTEAMADIAASEAQAFTILDAKKGYHQCLMDEQSQLPTTFVTPFGHFRSKRAPYGLSLIAKHYNRRMAEAFERLFRFCQVVDDIVIYENMRLQTPNMYGSFYNGVKRDTSPSTRRTASSVADRLHLWGSSYLQRDTRLIHYNRGHHKISNTILMYRSAILF